MRISVFLGSARAFGSPPAVMQSFCKKARALRNATLGGVPAREFTIVCPSYDVIAVVALHRGRGYFFQLLRFPPA